MVKRVIGGNGNGAVVAATLPAQAEVRRMLLSAIKRAESSKWERVLIYGPEGIGKTWWANSWQAPVFICAEKGLKGIEPVPMAFPEAKDWKDVFDAIEELKTQPHEYKTLVVDTVDWLEAICHQTIAKREGKSSIESFGYGKGFNLACEEFRKLLAAFESLEEKCGMHIVMTAHSKIKTFSNPTGDNFDRYQMKVHDQVYGVLKEWCDAVLFANYDIIVDSEKGDRKGKAVDSTAMIHAVNAPNWSAKNRYRITEPIPMDFNVFWEYVEKSKEAQ